MNISQRSREVYNKIATGWNTWDIQSVTAHVYLPERIRLHIGFMIPHLNSVGGNNLWDNVESFGEHSVGGSYTEVTIRYFGGIYKIETSAKGEELVIRITPEKIRTNCYVLAEISGIWGESPNICNIENGVLATKGEKSFILRSRNNLSVPEWNPSYLSNITCLANETVYFSVNSIKTTDEINRQLAEARREWLESTIQATGKLEEGLTALRRSLLWNTVYDSINARVITPVSRDWSNPMKCKWSKLNINVFGDYVLFGWDTFFASLQFGLIDKELAYANMFSILEELTEEGMIANVAAATGRTRDRSEPQVGALCAWKLYVQFGEKWFVEEVFDRLLTWNRWRFKERDCNGDGLLEIASNPWDANENEEVWSNLQGGTKQGAMFESGLDNSTMWDRANFNKEKHCLELSYVGLNAEMIIDGECLEKMALLLGRNKEKAELEERRIRLTKLINSTLWSEDAKCYLNRHWSGEFDPCLSLTHFYTITAGIAIDNRLDYLLNEHLLNEKEFWGEFVIPNISKGDPSFSEQEYWRGRIWAPTNFIVGEGIKRIGRLDILDELVQKGLELFVNCWKDRGVVGENYNAITGEAAEPNKASDRFYHWGALLVYMAVERIVDFNEWQDRIIINRSMGVDTSLRNVPMKNSKIDVLYDTELEEI